MLDAIYCFLVGKLYTLFFPFSLGVVRNEFFWKGNIKENL